MTMPNCHHQKSILLLLTLIVFIPACSFKQPGIEDNQPNGITEEQKGFFVAPDGDDANPGTFNEPWRTLNHALPRLQAGDILYIRGGSYKVNLLLDEDNSGTTDNPILVMAYQDEIVTLVNSTIRFHHANWWILSGLRFEPVTRWGVEIGEGGSATNQSRDVTTHHITILNSAFMNGDHEGIAILNGDDIMVDNCRFYNLRSGVADKDLNALNIYYKAHRVTLQNSQFQNIGSDGIHIGTFYYEEGADIRDIKILNNEFSVDRPYNGPFGNVGENGIDIKSSPGPILISGNTFHGFRATLEGQDNSGADGEALVLHWASPGEPGASNVIIERNLFFDNTQHLVVTHNTHDITIRNNIFLDAVEDNNTNISQAAISIYDHSERIRIFQNTFVRNKYHFHSFTDTIVSVDIKNNVFIKGGFYAPEHENFQADSDYNVFGEVSGSIPPTISGLHDRISQDQLIDENYEPLPFSPLIDAGVNLDISNDFNGNPRPSGAGYDIGAVERQP
jgi:hypothetical protein